MTRRQFQNLHQGDIVRGKCKGDAYQVVSRYGDIVIVIRTLEIVNPDEWDLMFKANLQAIITREDEERLG